MCKSSKLFLCLQCEIEIFFGVYLTLSARKIFQKFYESPSHHAMSHVIVKVFHTRWPHLHIHFFVFALTEAKTDTAAAAIPGLDFSGGQSMSSTTSQPSHQNNRKKMPFAKPVPKDFEMAWSKGTCSTNKIYSILSRNRAFQLPFTEFTLFCLPSFPPPQWIEGRGYCPHNVLLAVCHQPLNFIFRSYILNL